MSRRDTILIAVLVNAGLLIILFATAINTNDKKNVIKVEKVAPKTEVKRTITAASQEQAKPYYRPQLSAPIKETPTFTYKPPAKVEAPVPRPIAVKHEAKPVVRYETPVESKKLNFVEVTVKSGDTLDRLARINGTSVKRIMTVNNLSITRLQVGQVLRIPFEADGDSENRNEERSKLFKKYYTVKSGDTLWDIAVSNNMSLDKLYELNHLNHDSARKLQPGDSLRIQ